VALGEWVARSTAGVGRSAPIREIRWMRQVHGSTVLVVSPPPGPGPRAKPSVRIPVTVRPAGEGDALVAGEGAVGLAVLTADCASIALGSRQGVFGAVHAGWRGLVDGVVEQAIATMETLGATDVVGALGPCIHPECYEFSDHDLDRVAARYGDGVRGRTSSGRPALDLPAAVSAALAAADARQHPGVAACTGCSDGYFSHRVRGDAGRQALVVWSAAGGGPG
jgi:copper oxidase (laccase) domain-containing protein